MCQNPASRDGAPKPSSFVGSPPAASSTFLVSELFGNNTVLGEDKET
jgi:hypothetical protein